MNAFECFRVQELDASIHGNQEKRSDRYDDSDKLFRWNMIRLFILERVLISAEELKRDHHAMPHGGRCQVQPYKETKQGLSTRTSTEF